jgi:hypothetical protein
MTPKEVLTFNHFDGVQVRGKTRVDVEDFLSIPDHAQKVTREDNLKGEGLEEGFRVRGQPPSSISPA